MAALGAAVKLGVAAVPSRGTIRLVSRPSGSHEAVFFRERNERREGTHRSLRRAAALAARWGIVARAVPPVIAVVGSKGKGTTATYASATLAAAGLRVGTLTSPGFVSNRERIRVNGRAIDDAAFAEIAGRLDATIKAAAPTLPRDGYLSPTGLFTLTAVRHFMDTECDVMVLEAGMGGMSDEISLFAPDVVCVTAIFGEHLGILGDSVEGIAANKLGVIRDTTAAVVSIAQPDVHVMKQVHDAAGSRLRVVDGSEDVAGPVPPGLVGTNARAGIVAAHALFDHLGIARAAHEDEHAVLRSVQLPGRLDVRHEGSRIWGIDAAISGAGAADARAWFEREHGIPTDVLTCIPDGKDADGVALALDGLNVHVVRVAADHLTFEGQPDATLLADVLAAGIGDRVLALGTITFVGELLERLGADLEQSFTHFAARAVGEELSRG